MIEADKNTIILSDLNVVKGITEELSMPLQFTITNVGERGRGVRSCPVVPF